MNRLAILMASVGAACSAAPTSFGSSTPSDRVVVEASATTRDATGITAWGIDNDAQSIVVHGYDSKNDPVVTFGTHAAQGAATTLAAIFEFGDRQSKLELEVTDGAPTRVIENSIKKDVASQKVLERMIADLRSGAARSKPSMVQPTNIRTLDLTSDEAAAQLTSGGCPRLVPPAAADAAAITQVCSNEPNSEACKQGTKLAKQGQDKANSCDQPSAGSCVPTMQLTGGGPPAARKEHLTGDGTSSIAWHVNGTDLGIPFTMPDQSTGFLFGDTFDSPNVGGPGWRSPVLLRAGSTPADGIVFTGSGYAKGIISTPHSGCNGEYTVIPNDGIALPGGRVVVSFMSVRNWPGLCPERYEGQWRTNYAGLAYSDDGGNSFTRAPIQFGNNDANDDPFQMQTMQLDGDYVYMYSVRAGRQPGPMMLQRVPVASILERGAYQCWSGNGSWGGPCAPVADGVIGEPSVRKLADCTWAMSYLEGGSIVTKTAQIPEGPWSPAKIQVSFSDQPCLYGGFIHPKSTAKDLHLMVSQWGDSPGNCGQGGRYGVDHFAGSL